MKSMAILTDVTRCIGCEECVTACQRANGTGLDAPYRWQRNATDVSSTRWTSIVEAGNNRFVRLHCRHCLDPSCAAACPVGALESSPQGPVVYDADICMGCRYCMMACPFGLTRYEWSSANPRVRKCFMCFDGISSGELEQPACTSACPAGATVFGERDVLITEARRRIQSEPDRYLDHIWGEEELGGTSVLYVSDVDLGEAGWPHSIDERARPALARKVMNTVPFTFVGVAAVMAGIRWTYDRRLQVARDEGGTGLPSDGASKPSRLESSSEERD